MKKVPPVLSEFYVLYKAVKICYSKKSYLKSKGFTSSLRKKRPFDSNGNPVPWMNYSFIEFINERLNKEMDFFEYGCGFSTLYFQKRVKTITSVESDRMWHEKISGQVDSNSKIIFCPADEDGNYARSIHGEQGEFDIILVDGRDRVNCIKQSVSKLKSEGVIILDDSDRQRYSEGFSFLKDKGFKCLSIKGLKPSSIEGHQATIFYRPGNCFKI